MAYMMGMLPLWFEGFWGFRGATFYKAKWGQKKNMRYFIGINTFLMSSVVFEACPATCLLATGAGLLPYLKSWFKVSILFLC